MSWKSRGGGGGGAEYKPRIRGNNDSAIKQHANYCGDTRKWRKQSTKTIVNSWNLYI